MLQRRQIEQYNKEGYTTCPHLLNSNEISELLRDIQDICSGNTLEHHEKERLEMEPNQAPNGTLVRRIYEPCTYYPRFRSLSESAKVLDRVQQLIGANLAFHYSKINMKPSQIGSAVEWHQDVAYYPLTNPDSLAILFYLDDADRSNGCLQVVPGAHTSSLMNHSRDKLFLGKITDFIDESRAVPIAGNAGTAIFMHCMTPHSSTINTSTQPRRTLILSYRAVDALPIYFGEMTVKNEMHTRLVRGEPANIARLSGSNIPIPRYPAAVSSLYELQEISRDKNPGKRIV